MEYHQNIVDKYGKIVYGIAMSHMGNVQDAEDVFQEVFLTYLKKNPIFFEEEKARAWFARTTFYHCKMKWRDIAKHAAVPIEEAEGLYAEDKAESDVITAVKELPHKYRDVIELFYFSELSTNEIAAALKITTPAVRTRLKRGRKMLESLLKSEVVQIFTETDHS